MPVQFGEKKLPDRAIVIAHYAAWAFVTLLIFWLAGVF
jgi:fumarate reductase subunit C